VNAELEHFLTEGPRTVKDLARLTDKSTSTIYKALKADERVVEGPEGATGKTFYIPAAPETGQGTIEEQVRTDPTDEVDIVAPAPVKSPAKVGRRSRLEGRAIFPLGQENKRRKGSHGFRSFQILLDNPGIAYEDYLKAGGRLVDLRWDILHGNAKAI